MILKLKKQMKKMQQQMNEIFEETHEQLDKESKASEQVIKESAKRLMKIKHEKNLPSLQDSQQTQENVVDMDNWEIEYEE
jgi:hypothetical protein